MLSMRAATRPRRPTRTISCPAISDIPDFEFLHANTPSKSIGGMRGVGEGGAIIGSPTLVNAICRRAGSLLARCPWNCR